MEGWRETDAALALDRACLRLLPRRSGADRDAVICPPPPPPPLPRPPLLSLLVGGSGVVSMETSEDEGEASSLSSRRVQPFDPAVKKFLEVSRVACAAGGREGWKGSQRSLPPSFFS